MVMRGIVSKEFLMEVDIDIEAIDVKFTSSEFSIRNKSWKA